MLVTRPTTTTACATNRGSRRGGGGDGRRVGEGGARKRDVLSRVVSPGDPRPPINQNSGGNPGLARIRAFPRSGEDTDSIASARFQRKRQVFWMDFWESLSSTRGEGGGGEVKSLVAKKSSWFKKSR